MEDILDYVIKYLRIWQYIEIIRLMLTLYTSGKYRINLYALAR
jgi:hypothetical protein